MYGIPWVNNLPSDDILTFVQSCHEMAWHLYKHVTNAFNVRESVSIETKVYTYEIRAYDISYLSDMCLLHVLGFHWQFLN